MCSASRAAAAHDANTAAARAFFNQTGSTNSLLYDPTRARLGNISANLAIRGLTSKVFWTPVQYLRIGLQYTHATTAGHNAGASHNYDGAGRNAGDNNFAVPVPCGARTDAAIGQASKQASHASRLMHEKMWRLA